MKVLFVKFSISILTVTILLLVFIFPGQANAAHCDVVYRDCSAECPGGTYDCLASCNQANSALYEQSRECALQVHDQEQGEEETEDSTKRRAPPTALKF